MAGGKKMAPRFFADETDLALGKALAIARADVVHPGHLRLPEVPLGTYDEDWLPIVGHMQLVVITRDARIRRKPIEKAAWCTHRVRGFALTGKTSQSTWDSLRILARRWDEIEKIISDQTAGPWMYSVTGGMREIDLGLTA
jgi:PIN like domain